MKTFTGLNFATDHHWLDCNDPKAVEIKITKRQIWINTEDGCLCRILRPGIVQVVDERAEDDKEDPD